MVFASLLSRGFALGFCPLLIAALLPLFVCTLSRVAFLVSGVPRLMSVERVLTNEILESIKMIEFMTDISAGFYDLMEEIVQMLGICFPFVKYGQIYLPPRSRLGVRGAFCVRACLLSVGRHEHARTSGCSIVLR